WAQRLRSCPVRRLDRLVEHESQRLHGAERAWQDGFTGLRLLGAELLRGYLDPACLFRITIRLAEERQPPPKGSARHGSGEHKIVAYDAAARGLVADGLRPRRDEVPSRVAQLDPRRRFQGREE